MAGYGVREVDIACMLEIDPKTLRRHYRHELDKGHIKATAIGTGRAADREKALAFDAQEFVDVENDVLEDVGTVDLLFDVIGGDIGKRSAGLVRAGGTLVSIVGPTATRPVDGLAVDFVVEPNRVQLSEIVRRVRDGQLRTNIGNVSILDDAVAAFNPTERRTGKTIIRVRT